MNANCYNLDILLQRILILFPFPPPRALCCTFRFDGFTILPPIYLFLPRNFLLLEIALRCPRNPNVGRNLECTTLGFEILVFSLVSFLKINYMHLSRARWRNPGTINHQI